MKTEVNSRNFGHSFGNGFTLWAKNLSITFVEVQKRKKKVTFLEPNWTNKNFLLTYCQQTTLIWAVGFILFCYGFTPEG